MVRLKGEKFFNKYIPVYISIPYGAIKSFQDTIGVLSELTFQFLMVRLKGRLYATC